MTPAPIPVVWLHFGGRIGGGGACGHVICCQSTNFSVWPDPLGEMALAKVVSVAHTGQENSANQADLPPKGHLLRQILSIA